MLYTLSDDPAFSPGVEGEKKGCCGRKAERGCEKEAVAWLERLGDRI
jgi:hypothetical protein